MNVRLAASIGSDFSCEAYKRTLYQPYSVHMQTNSSGLIAAISTYIGQTVSTLTSVLQLMNASVVTLCILGTLLAIDWFVACVAVFAFGTAYTFLVFIARRRLGFNSRLIALAQKEQIKSLQEGLGAIRDVLLDGSQSVFIDIYQSSDGPMRMRSAQNNFLARFPRYALRLWV